MNLKRKYDNANNDEDDSINIPPPPPLQYQQQEPYLQQQLQQQDQLTQSLSTYSNRTENTKTAEPANKKRKLSQQKRDRECQKRNYKYSEGKDIINGSKATDDEINEYEEFIKETVFCKCCTKEVSVKDILLFNDEIYCMNCLKQLAKEGEIDMNYLKKDYFENKNYDEKEMEGKLYKCKRLNHARPVSHFIELIKGKHKFVTNCIYCRNYKAIYYVMKNKNISKRQNQSFN